MNDIILFATNDILLKEIFINTYGDGGMAELISAVLSKGDSQKIFNIINDNQGNRRVKPDFTENPTKYFNKLIEYEKQLVRDNIIKNCL
jgi:hypothetical protein